MPRKSKAASTKVSAEPKTADVLLDEAEKAPLEKALERGYQERQAAIAPPSSTGDTVTVGLKMPNGLLLQLQSKVEVEYPVMGGGMRIESQWRPDHHLPTFTLHGNRAPFGEQPRCLVIGGYAMTPGIPADFMAKWMEQNKNLDLVKANLIIVHSTTERARAEAIEKRGTRHGMEPLNPGSDLRAPKKTVKGKVADAIETGDEQPAVA